jgi:hypothetical protein
VKDSTIIFNKGTAKTLCELRAMLAEHGLHIITSDERAALDTFVQAVQGVADERAAGATPEQQALSALHTWLHSPGGDGDLIDACQDWHETLADEECNRLEHEHCERPSSERIEFDVPRNVFPLQGVRASDWLKEIDES